MSQFNSRSSKTFLCCSKGWENTLVPLQVEGLHLLLLCVARAWVPLPLGGIRGAVLQPHLSAGLFALVL